MVWLANVEGYEIIKYIIIWLSSTLKNISQQFEVEFIFHLEVAHFRGKPKPQTKLLQDYRSMQNRV